MDLQKIGSFLKELRKEKELTQEQLAEKADISRTFLSAIEAPSAAICFSLEVLYNIADALQVNPADLLNASVLPDSILNPKT